MRALVLAALLLAAPAAGALDPLALQDDAGAGADAPDERADAWTLAAGTHTGTLHPPLDAEDWYRVDVPADQKLRVTFRATAGSFWLEVLDAAARPLWQGFSSGSEFYYLSPLGGSYWLRLDSGEVLQGATYSLRVQHVTPPVQNDAGVPGDAGHLASLARPIGEGTSTGLLHPDSGDTRDFYAIAPPSGTWTVVTLSAEPGVPVWLDLEDWRGWAHASGSATGAPITLTRRGSDTTAIEVATTTSGASTSYALTVAFVPPVPSAQDDAGLGTDAPNTAAGAALLGPGVYHGVVDTRDEDPFDFYRVETPAGKHLRAALRVHEGVADYRLHAGGSTEDRTLVFWDEQGDLAAGAGARVLQIGSWSGSVIRYTLTIEHNGAPIDVAPTALRVDPDAPPGEPAVRTVRATVSAVGGGCSDTLFVVQVIDSTTLPVETLHVSRIAVATGGVLEFEMRWDTTGLTGEFTLRAETGCREDARTSNDVRTVRASAARDPGLGVGTVTFV